MSGLTWVAALGSLLVGASASAQTVRLPSSQDNTLYEDLGGSVSNGAGEHLFAGRSGASSPFPIKRTLIAFDVAAGVPAGATIDAVEVRLHLSQTSSGPQQMDLHRVAAAWGESISDAPGSESGGAPAEARDATWIQRFRDGGAWQSAGGDFAPGPSASAIIDGPQTYTWLSTPALVADVQQWLDQPADNHGWLLKGEETMGGTAKRFDSRENPTPGFRPSLTVRFTLPGPSTYCTAKTAVTCGPAAIGFQGASSASSPSGFEVAASPVLGQASGLWLYSASAPAAQPFQGGWLCVAAPVRRALPVNAGGTTGACDGRFAIDVNAFASGSLGGTPAEFLGLVGQPVRSQWWGRDTPSKGSVLSDALAYFVGP